MSRIVKLLDGRTVQIDNDGNIISEVGTFEKLNKNNYTPQQTTRLPNPDNNVNISGKIDNIDLGDINKSDNTAQVETPVENVVKRTPSTPPHRRVETSVTPTSKGGKGSGSASSSAGNKGNKGGKGGKDIIPKDTTITTPTDTTTVKVNSTPTKTQNKGYYKGTRYSKNGNYKFEHDGKGNYKTYIKSKNGYVHVFTDRRHGSVTQDEDITLNYAKNKQFNNRTGKLLTNDEIKERTLLHNTPKELFSLTVTPEKNYLDAQAIKDYNKQQNDKFNSLGLADYVGGARGLTKALTKAAPSTVAASKNMFSKMTDSYPLIEKAIRRGSYKEARDIIKTVASRYKTNTNELLNRFSKEFSSNNDIRYRRGVENVKKFIQDVKKGNINKPKSKYDGGTGKQTAQSKKAQREYINNKNRNNPRVNAAQNTYQQRQQISPSLNNIMTGLRNNAKRNQPSLLERVNNKISTYLQKKGLYFE